MERIRYDDMEQTIKFQICLFSFIGFLMANMMLIVDAKRFQHHMTRSKTEEKIIFTKEKHRKYPRNKTIQRTQIYIKNCAAAQNQTIFQKKLYKTQSLNAISFLRGN